MSPKPPAPIDEAGTVQDWVVSLVIDGVPTDVKGTLFLRHRPSPAWWMFGLAGVALVVALSMMKRQLMAAALAAVALAGVLVGSLEYVGLPEGARITPVLLMFSCGALTLFAGLVAARRIASQTAAAFAAGGGLTLAIAAWLCSDQVQAAYIPGLDAGWPARMVIPVMLGAGIAVTIDGVMRVVRPHAMD